MTDRLFFSDPNIHSNIVHCNPDDCQRACTFEKMPETFTCGCCGNAKKVKHEKSIINFI